MPSTTFALCPCCCKDCPAGYVTDRPTCDAATQYLDEVSTPHGCVCYKCLAFSEPPYDPTHDGSTCPSDEVFQIEVMFSGVTDCPCQQPNNGAGKSATSIIASDLNTYWVLTRPNSSTPFRGPGPSLVGKNYSLVSCAGSVNQTESVATTIEANCESGSGTAVWGITVTTDAAFTINPAGGNTLFLGSSASPVPDLRSCATSNVVVTGGHATVAW